MFYSVLAEHPNGSCKRSACKRDSRVLSKVNSRVLTRGVGPPVLCHSLMERLFCLPNVQICAVLAALNIINYITLFMPACFVLRMDKFLPQCVGRFKVNQDMMFIEGPPESPP